MRAGRGPSALGRGHDLLRIHLRSRTIAGKLRGLVEAAERAGLRVVVDSDAVAIKLMPQEDEASAADLRTAGIDTVRVHNACGSGAAAVGSWTPGGAVFDRVRDQRECAACGPWREIDVDRKTGLCLDCWRCWRFCREGRRA